MSNKIIKSMIFGLLFLLIDLFFFGFLSFIKFIFLEFISSKDAFNSAITGIMLRCIFFQAGFEFILLTLSKLYGVHRSVFICVGLSVVALVMAGLIVSSLKASYVLSLFSMEDQGHTYFIGPGLVLAASAFFAWAILAVLRKAFLWSWL